MSDEETMEVKDWRAVVIECAAREIARLRADRDKLRKAIEAYSDSLLHSANRHEHAAGQHLDRILRGDEP